MKTALFLALLAGTLLSTSGEGSLGATRTKLRTLREQVNLLGEILERTERVADMAARQEGGDNADEDDSRNPLGEILERFFYGFMGLLQTLAKGEDFKPKLSSLSEMLAGLPKNFSKVTHNSEQKGNTTVNTTTTIEKSQGDGKSYSFGKVQTSVDGPNQKSFSSVVQQVFQSSSGFTGGDNTPDADGDTPPAADGDTPPAADNVPDGDTPPAGNNTVGDNPPATATPTPKAADDGAKSARNLKLLDILELLRNAKTEEN
ncbi:Hypp3124 [Branchiostoma lanceolatum]|uniref:Hypp3124 protein n=1 Tax=Branchiostoma lanceolatum TaxID=7740 RepID=A0A8J9ZX41_BRALA|nr:Hypp3124 [Branchiostoma lanceolatum]